MLSPLTDPEAGAAASPASNPKLPAAAITITPRLARHRPARMPRPGIAAQALGQAALAPGAPSFPLSRPMTIPAASCPAATRAIAPPSQG
jgi:hypothetical protein